MSNNSFLHSFKEGQISKLHQNAANLEKMLQLQANKRSIDGEIIEKCSKVIKLSKQWSMSPVKDSIQYNWEQLTSYDQQMRLLTKMAGFMNDLLDWRSTPVGLAPYLCGRHNLNNQEHSFAYDRDGNFQSAFYSREILKLHGLDPRKITAILTNSGMSASTLVNHFLFCEVFKENKQVLIWEDVWWETAKRWKGLEHLVDLNFIPKKASPDQIVSMVKRVKPGVLCIDPLSANNGLNSVDVQKIIENLREEYHKPLYVVCDNTLAPTTVHSFSSDSEEKIELIVWESLSKHTQFGMDAIHAGVVFCSNNIKEKMQDLAVSLGVGLFPNAIGSLTIPDKTDFELRSKKMALNAALVFDYLNEQEEKALLLSCPGSFSHPGFSFLKNQSALLSIEFTNKTLNTPSILRQLVKHLVEMAQREGIPLVAGESFGFSHPRVTVIEPYGFTDCFIRFSAGLGPEKSYGKIGEILLSCVKELKLKKKVS